MPKKLILRKKPTISNPVYGEQFPKKIRLVRKKEGDTIKKFKNPRKLNTHFKSEVPIEDLLIWAAEEPEDEEVEEENEYIYEEPNYFHEMDLAHNKNITDPLILNAMKFWTKHNKTTNKFLKYEDIKDEYEYWD